jgi:hypothetical protein
MTGAVWMRVALVNLIVMAAGFGIGVVLLPYGVVWMIAAGAFTAAAVVIPVAEVLAKEAKMQSDFYTKAVLTFTQLRCGSESLDYTAESRSSSR